MARLTANSLAEAVTVVDKIVHYDEAFRSADWQHRVLFVADNALRPETSLCFPMRSSPVPAV